MKIDNEIDIIITGATTSNDFPLMNAIQTDKGAGRDMSCVPATSQD